MLTFLKNYVILNTENRTEEYQNAQSGTHICYEY